MLDGDANSFLNVALASLAAQRRYCALMARVISKYKDNELLDDEDATVIRHIIGGENGH